MWTTNSQWATPASTVFLYSSEEDDAIPVLEHLGVLVMHPQAGAFARRMTGRAAVLDGLIEMYGGSLSVADDSAGTGKTVYVAICLAGDR